MRAPLAALHITFFIFVFAAFWRNQVEFITRHPMAVQGL